MTAASPGELGSVIPADEPGAAEPAPKRRDASSTRLLLLDAARKRFASNGYQATTVRDISDDAGVNVALISRYFGSKEGLFRACLAGAVDQLGGTVPADMTLAEVPDAIARQLAGPESDKHPSQILLLMRSSQDAEAERIRLDILRTFAERLASVAGWRPGAPGADRLLFNSQVALAATLGISMLRASSTLEPLTSAGRDDLVDPLTDLMTGLLSQQ